MYKIIGGDQREYGPATAEEVCRWIAEGRLSGQSLVQAVGSGEWRALSSYPEFAGALRAQVRAESSGGAAAPPLESAAWLAEVLARRPEVRVGECLALSWNLLRRNLGLLAAASFLVWALSVVSEVNKATLLVYVVLHGVLFGGLSLVFLRRMRGEPAAVSGVFAGFSLAFPQLLLAGFVSYLLTFLASFCCFVPGLYLFVAWLFCVPLVIDKRLEFWSAMELSRRVVTRVWFQVFALVVVAFLPTLSLFFLMQLHIMAALLPLIQNAQPGGNPPDFARLLELLNQAPQAAHITPAILYGFKLIFLLNLPFGLGALLHAYESLFGARPAPAA